MIPAVLLFTVVILALVEIASRREDLRRLSVSFSLDAKLSEPGEIVTLRYTVQNTSLFPMLYVGLTLRLDPVFTPEEDEEFMRRHTNTDFTGTQINHHFFLAPKRRFSGKLRFSVKQRGLYDLGKYYLELGDFLGLKPQLRTGSLDLRIICTAAPCEPPAIQALGGNVYVTRGYFDDPTLIIGTRDYSGREPLKQISWNQSAKAGRLIVRQNDFTTDRTAVVIVNIDPTYRKLMERCLSMTSSVCQLLEKEKIPYSMMSNGDLHSLTEGLGTSHLFSIQRRIGLSSHTGYVGFSSVVSDCIRMKILLSPRNSMKTRVRKSAASRGTPTGSLLFSVPGKISDSKKGDPPNETNIRFPCDR